MTNQKNEKLESEQNSVTFYPGKAQLMPIAFNIAVAPMLLYLVRLWPWPPTVLHLGVFMLTSIIAIRFVRSRLGKAKLVFDESGIHSGTSYSHDSIEAVKPYMRALQIWVKKDGKVKEKVINLWWASKTDIQAIYAEAVARYPAKD